MTNFIGEYKIDDSMCDALIEHHRNSEKISGKVGYKDVDKSAKDSKDVHVNIYTNKLIKDYINEIRSLARVIAKHMYGQIVLVLNLILEKTLIYNITHQVVVLNDGTMNKILYQMKELVLTILVKDT